MNRRTFIDAANQHSSSTYRLAGQLANALSTQTPDEQLYAELRTLTAIIEHAKLAELSVRLALRGAYDKRKLKS